MKDSILEILNNSNKALTIEEIDDRLNIKSIEETKQFLSLLNELEELTGRVMTLHPPKISMP